MNTLFALLAKYGDINIPLEKCCRDYFGMEVKKANERACLQDLPVPTYKLGGGRSPWFVSAEKLAEHIDKKRAEAEKDWSQLRA